MMSGEEDTRKLLQFRESLENKMRLMEEELEDVRKAISEIDKVIVRQGFRQPAASTQALRTLAGPQEPSDEAGPSIIAKDGTTLGRMQMEGDVMIFTPSEEFQFTTGIPPFRSFLVERVLSNMRAADEERAANGEIPPDKIIEFQVQADGELLQSVTIKNYRDERRLREIQSSLRWTFDKMYDKIRQG